MLRFAFLVLLSIFTSASINAQVSPTTSIPPPTPNPNCRFNSLTFNVQQTGQSFTVNPNTVSQTCSPNASPYAGKSRIIVKSTQDMNFYILFTKTDLNKQQTVFILNSNNETLSQCSGSDNDGSFCPPVIMLENSFILELPGGLEDAIQVVIVSTTAVPYYYYAYSRLPAWAAVTTVIATFVFLFLMTGLCCCCLVMMCRRQHHRRAATHSSGPTQCRNLPGGPPLYSTDTPVFFDLPPIYVAREEGPLPQKTTAPVHPDA